MDTYGAMCRTMELARERVEEAYGSRDDEADLYPDANLAHLESMLEQVRDTQDTAEEFSKRKIKRWLGYMQGVLVARGLIELDEFKQINKDHAG